MKISKYEHACLILEDNGNKLVIDPGCFSKLPDELHGVNVVIVTEEHVDHYDLDNLRRILDQSPSAVIYSTAKVVEALAAEKIDAKAITGKQTIQDSGFTISFYETDHAPIYQNPPCKSLSIKINNSLYFTSDSYQVIDDEVEVLALPTSGPWFKVAEAVDLANAVKSKKLLATHNGLNSETGHNVTHHFLQTHLADQTRELIFLQPGESTDI